MEFKEVRECEVLYISKVYETPIHEFRTPYYILGAQKKHVLMFFKSKKVKE